MKITFFGAAQQVTGSKHLIETNNYKLLLDCGLHQGKRSESNRLNKNLPFLAKEIDAVILSHAHTDHCGTLPILVRKGFKGKIYCTAATADIAKLILEDSAMIQEQDAAYYNRHLKPGEQEIEPIYTKEDVARTLDYFSPVPYFSQSKKWTTLNENIRFKFYDAGHILGSAISLIEIKDEGKTKCVAFTGDLGRKFLPILRSPEYVDENAQVLISECTYGSRFHKPMADLEGKIKEIVNAAVRQKSKVMVPAFSLGRTQELIYMLHKLADKNEIPSIPIYVDSPLASRITEVFGKYTGDFDEEFWQDFGEKGESAFVFKNLNVVKSVEESKSINEKPGPFVVIAGSGMMEGGRILHHLKNNIEDENSMILITGYQAESTLGRRILEGVSPVRIFGRQYHVKSKVHTLNELSAHADQRGLLDYIGNTKGLKKLFLVHTETREEEAFRQVAKKEYTSLSIEAPTAGQSFEV